MAIHMISGVPGAGKTLRSVFKVLELMEKEPDRPVFGNVSGFKHQAEIPDEWMDVPDGSVILIDEVQQRWRRYRATGEPPAEIVALEKHRHRGIDFILTCQNPAQLSGDVRALVDTHEHLTIQVRHKSAVVYRFLGECHTSPSSKRSAFGTEKEIWVYPKKVFQAYESSVQHTGKSTMPRYLKKIIFALVAMVVCVGLAVWKVGSFAAGPIAEVEAAGVDNGEVYTQVEDAIDKGKDKDSGGGELIVAVIRNADDTQCKMFNRDNLRVKATLIDCLNMAESYLPDYYTP